MSAAAIINFFIAGKTAQFARRTMYYVPRIGETCVFDDVRYIVLRVEWCLDHDATPVGTRVNIEMYEV